MSIKNAESNEHRQQSVQRSHCSKCEVQGRRVQLPRRGFVSFRRLTTYAGKHLRRRVPEQVRLLERLEAEVVVVKVPLLPNGRIENVLVLRRNRQIPGQYRRGRCGRREK